MSTHNLDVSGQRALTVRMNDPASTYAATPAKAGDDVTATLSGFRELRVELPGNARIQRRKYVRSTVRNDENNRPMKDDAGDLLYDEVEYEKMILVLQGGTFFGRSSNLPEDAIPEGKTQEPASYEMTPHTNIVARRSSDLHFLESGELVEEYVLDEIAQAFTVELEADGGAGE